MDEQYDKNRQQQGQHLGPAGNIYIAVAYRLSFLGMFGFANNVTSIHWILLINIFHYLLLIYFHFFAIDSCYPQDHERFGKWEYGIIEVMDGTTDYGRVQ